MSTNEMSDKTKALIMSAVNNDIDNADKYKVINNEVFYESNAIGMISSIELKNGGIDLKYLPYTAVVEITVSFNIPPEQIK